MKTALITGGGIVAALGGAVILARYGRSRFAKECTMAWAGTDVQPQECAYQAGDYSWLTAIGMGLRAITGGNVYANYAQPGVRPPMLFAGQPPGQVMPPGQMQPGQAGNVFTTTQPSGN